MATPSATTQPPIEVATHCPYCAMQCGMTLRAGEDGQVHVLARDFPTNRGALCQKGWAASQLLDHPERLTTPLIRDPSDGLLRPASWSDALDMIATRVAAIQRGHGHDAVAVFGGGGLTNEKAYALGKLARVALRTANIDYNGRFCMSSAAAAGNRAFGIDRGLPFPMADIAETGTLLLVGANIFETMPPFARYLTEQRARGGTQIVIDPRATPTARAAHLWLQPTPGTDLALANGLLHIAVMEGLIDESYLATRTTGFERVRQTVAAYWPARVERLTGVPIADLERVARALAAPVRQARGGGHAGPSGTIILTARGAEQHAKGVDTVTAFINLALALGLPGRPRSGYGCLTGQGNGQGGREHGQKADQLPGYRKIDDPAARAHVAKVWGIDPDDLPEPGLSAYELLDALGTGGGPRALLVFGSNPVVSAPNATHIEGRLRSLEFLVVTDFVLSETAALADVVLPTAQWAEEDGTMTNLEGRVIRRRALREPPPGVWTDLMVIAELAERLGTPPGARFDASPLAVFEELREASAGGTADYSGITWERVDAEHGVFWPCASTDAAGSPRLFEDSFPTPDGRARLHPVEHRPVAEEIDDEFPLYLTTGRVASQYQSGAQTRRIPGLAGTPFLELHPDLAERLGVRDGQDCRITSRRGTMIAPARITDTIRPDTVFTPFHFPGSARANSLTGDALDPISRMPEFKVCAVRVEPLAGVPS